MTVADADPFDAAPKPINEPAAESPFAEGSEFKQSGGNDPFAADPNFSSSNNDPFAGPAPKEQPSAHNDPFAGPAPAPKKQPKAVDLKRRSPAELQIDAALSKPTHFDFLDEPLADAMNYVAQVHNIQVIIDKNALEDEGIGDTPVNIKIKNIPLRNALNLTLRQLHLDYVIHDECLVDHDEDRC